MARFEFKKQSSEFLNNMQVISGHKDNVGHQIMLVLCEIARSLDRLVVEIARPLP